MADHVLIDRAVVQQALEALENCSSEYGHRCNRCDSEVDEGGKVASALRTALAQQQAEPVQEPVAWMVEGSLYASKEVAQKMGGNAYTLQALYTAPQQAEPVQRKPATGAESCVPSPSFQMTTQAEPVQREDYENRQCASAIRARGS